MTPEQRQQMAKALEQIDQDFVFRMRQKAELRRLDEQCAQLIRRRAAVQRKTSRQHYLTFNILNRRANDD